MRGGRLHTESSDLLTRGSYRDYFVGDVLLEVEGLLE